MGWAWGTGAYLNLSQDSFYLPSLLGCKLRKVSKLQAIVLRAALLQVRQPETRVWLDSVSGLAPHSGAKRRPFCIMNPSIVHFS